MTTSKDPDRLRVSGNAEERALLSVPAPQPPPALQDHVRAAVERRFSPRGSRPARWRPVLIGGAVLLGGTALALGLVRSRPAPPIPPVPAVAPRPSSVAPPPGAPIPEDPRLDLRRHRNVSPAPPAPNRGTAERDRPFGDPGLAEPPGRWGDPTAAQAQPALPDVAAARMVIAREGRRTIEIDVVGTRIVGKVRDAAFALELIGQRIIGKLGDENVLLLLHDTEAQGSIANHEVGFQLSTTPTGHLLRGSVPAHTTRVEMTDKTLSYYPGCDEPLVLVAPRTYAGSCGGGKTQVVVPVAWQRLPPLTRLILLSLLLPEREAGLPDNPRALFGPPDWPAR